jgi:hypothetical protein
MLKTAVAVCAPCLSVSGCQKKTNPQGLESFRNTIVVRFRSQLNNSAAHRDRHRLRPVAGAQLFHDVFNVNLHGFL